MSNPGAEVLLRQREAKLSSVTRTGPRSVAVAALSGTSRRGTPPKPSNASAWPSCHDLWTMSRNPSYQNLPEQGRTTTSTQTFEAAPVILSTILAVSPAQSM